VEVIGESRRVELVATPITEAASPGANTDHGSDSGRGPWRASTGEATTGGTVYFFSIPYPYLTPPPYRIRNILSGGRGLSGVRSPLDEQGCVNVKEGDYVMTK